MADVLCEELSDRLLMWASKYDIDLSDAQRDLTIILSNYKIEPKETALVVYTEGKNEFLLKRFLLAKAISGCTKKTIEHYKKTIEKFLHDINKDADTITSEEIQCYFANRMINGNSKSYIDTIRRYLSSFYAFLIREELTTKNPIAKIEKIKFHNEKESALSDYEVERIRGACQTARERAIVEILLSTGCRASEVTSIKIVDIGEDTITVLGKGEKYRKVYLNAKCIVALQTYMSERKDKSPYLFPSAVQANSDKALMGKFRHIQKDWYKNPELVNESRSMNKESINSCVKKIAKRAGVEGVHTHRFRRTCATMALRRGMTIELVSKMLGHEQIATTQIYLDLHEKDLKDAHEKFVY